jgi:ABC-type oligopeptide transport system substrate-binding subunit
MVLAALAALAALWLGRTEPQPRADIRFVSAEVFTLDPQRMSWQQDLRVARALYEPLLVRDAVTGLPKAGLAESWSCSEDGRTWTFALRRDARWSDGAPVTVRGSNFGREQDVRKWTDEEAAVAVSIGALPLLPLLSP